MESRRKLFRAEIAICLALMLLCLLAGVGFTVYYYENVSTNAALVFMRVHKAMGEDPSFILGAVDGLGQPPEVLLEQARFQIGVIVFVMMELGLGWLTVRLWKAQPR